MLRCPRTAPRFGLFPTRLLPRSVRRRPRRHDRERRVARGPRSAVSPRARRRQSRLAFRKDRHHRPSSRRCDPRQYLPADRESVGPCARISRHPFRHQTNRTVDGPEPLPRGAAGGVTREGARPRWGYVHARCGVCLVVVRAQTRRRRTAFGACRCDARGRLFAARFAVHADGFRTTPRLVAKWPLFAVRCAGRWSRRRRRRGDLRAQAALGCTRTRRHDSRHARRVGPVERRRRQLARAVGRRATASDARSLSPCGLGSVGRRSHRVSRHGHTDWRRDRIREFSRTLARPRREAGAVRHRFGEGDCRPLADRCRCRRDDESAAGDGGPHAATTGELRRARCELAVRWLAVPRADSGRTVANR